MIFHVSEWYDNDCNQFFFDSSKVDPLNKFETAYSSLLLKASGLEHPYSAYKNPSLMKSIHDRFGKYSDNMKCWNNLLTKPPCMVDVSVSIVMSS
jgi:hypothetical protein